MLIQDGTAKKNDLQLRIKYIGLKTELYLVEDYKYVIHCMNYSGDFKKLSDDFDYSIRHVGTYIVLEQSRPTKFIKKIDSIPLDNVVDGFKSPCITQVELETFLESRFNNIDIMGIHIPKTGLDFEIKVDVSANSEDDEIERMHQILLSSDLGTDKISIEKVENALDNTQNSKKAEKNFDVMQLSLIKDLPFTINEANFWYEHAEDIYTGAINRKDICFYRDNSLKCFLDFSVFDNIDLRSTLLLYDTVYIALPIDDHLERFLESQNIKIKDLIDLVDMGKVVLLLPNHEARYDRRLILEAYKCSPNSVIGRRGINTLIAAHLNETKRQYLNRMPGAFALASEMYLEGKKQENDLLLKFASTLAWPVISTAKSFGVLNQHSPMAISNFGINEIITQAIKEDENRNRVSFEFNFNVLSVHIAAALQATYFPFKQSNEDGTFYSDSAVSNIMGDLLKLYWYDPSNLETIKVLNRKNHDEHNFLNLFDCKHNINITKVAALADDFKTSDGFRNLLSHLDELDEKERKTKINEFNDLLFDIANLSDKKPTDVVQFLLGGTGFLPLNYAISSFLSILGILKDKVDESEFIKKEKELRVIERCIKQSGIKKTEGMVEDIYLLDKIQRVAMLK